MDGEAARFEALFAHTYDRVLAYALARADVDTAKEVAAEVFLVAWRRRAELPAEPNAVAGIRGAHGRKRWKRRMRRGSVPTPKIDNAERIGGDRSCLPSSGICAR